MEHDAFCIRAALAFPVSSAVLPSTSMSGRASAAIVTCSLHTHNRLAGQPVRGLTGTVKNGLKNEKS